MQIPVGRTFKCAEFIAPTVLAILFLILIPISLWQSWGAEIVLLVLAGIFALLTLIAAIYIKAGLRTLEDLESGFIVRDSKGEREFDDEHVQQIRCRSENNFENGTLKSVTEHYEIAADSGTGTQWIPMRVKRALDEGTYVATLFGRLQKLLLMRVLTDLDAGKTISGEGWTWTGNTLRVEQKKMPPVELRIDEIEALDLFDQNLCIWKLGTDEACAKIPEYAANVQILRALLDAKMPERDAKAAGSGLGRVLFQRGGARLGRWIGAAVALFFLMCTAALLINKELWAIATGLAAAGSIFALVANFKYSFRVHAYGVAVHRLWGVKTLRYSEVKTFTYSATRHYYNGAYTGTVMKMVFQPLDQSRDPRISYSDTIQNADDALDRLRDQISSIIAQRLAKEFSAGQRVEWTKNLRLIPKEGLEYNPAGYFGRKDPVLYKWEQISGFNLDQGVLHVWVKDQEKSVIQEQCSAPNFFPGFVLLVTLFAPEAKDEGEGEKAA